MKHLLLTALLSLSVITVSAQTVHVTNEGTKYHKKGCRYLYKSDKVKPLSEAKQQGYKPCKVCYSQQVNRTPSTNNRTSTARQCSGTTQSGNRCKRRTTSSTGRCYQH